MSFDVLAARSKNLEAAYPPANQKTPEDEAWEGSPFDWFRKKASATKGSIGRKLVLSIIEDAGYQPSTQGVSIKVNNTVILVRLSLMWGAGDFKFEQLRDKDYDFVFALGLYPKESYGWLIPKDEMIVDGTMQDREGLTPQHGGMGGSEDFWLTVNAAAPPGWLGTYGGNINSIKAVLARSL